MSVLHKLLLMSMTQTLRKANGNPILDCFWQELQAYLDELLLAVDDRRHGETLHMPLAISVRHENY